MSDYLSHYCALISSAAQLDTCHQAQSLSELLFCIKNLWTCHHLSDDELLSEISQLNKTPLSIDDVKLAGVWLPYRYQPRLQRVHWLLPLGHATEPFQDEYISRCRQQLLLNQIIQPSTSLNTAWQQAENLADVQPAGFIFHLSRCGSTLISGCLSELKTTCVFSESPLLTELILDGNLSPVEQQRYLRTLINLQAAAFINRPQVIIKWNAWDIFRWELIREIYPQVPVIFLVRNPVEILASHQKLAGRHMAGDPSMIDFHSVFKPCIHDGYLLDLQLRVLYSLLQAMAKVGEQAGVMVVDYSWLYAEKMQGISRHFSVSLQADELMCVQQRMKFHSKEPRHFFQSDSLQKQQLFSVSDIEKIHRILGSAYGKLLGIAR
jgi:hypothetical protein